MTTIRVLAAELAAERPRTASRNPQVLLPPPPDAACACLHIRTAPQGSQFSLSEVEVVTAAVDLDEVVSYRGAIASLQEQASAAEPVPLVRVDFE